MLHVAFIGPLSASFAEAVRARLSEPCELVVLDEADAPARMAEADVAVTLAFTAAMAAGAPRLRLVQVPGAGLNRIERAALPAGVALANVYGHEVGIAEFVLGAMISLSREFARLDGALRHGVWESQWAPGVPAPPPWPELAGKTLGILGYGRIGQELARRARAFGMTLLAIRRNPVPSQDDPLALLGGLDRLDEVLARSDFLAITLPLSEATRGLIGRRELARMRPTAVLVNVARGEIVDEDALFAALRERRIGAAALDVWYRYPSEPGTLAPARLPFHELPNVLMTPHISGWTDGMLEARARLMAENIDRTARGEPPLNRIDGPP